MFCYRCWLSIGGLFAGLSVAAGAFGAHGLDGYFHQKYAAAPPFEKKVVIGGTQTVVATMPLAQKYLADFKTGAEYQMYHGLALLAVGLLALRRPSKWLTVAGCCFVAGTLGFSGGLYAYTLTGMKWLGMTVVPLGGLLFLAGWFALVAAVSSRAGGDERQLVSLDENSAAARG
ncbi:MAG: DUF423 domain-containing protein [Planctomycetaceae bacterium]|nr:DUF423 domain-containing protein [Planctomycetaceae bacterium]